MTKFFLAASIAALCATPAFAADDVMADTYGNTVVSTGGMAEVHTHYRADHSFDMAASMMGMSQTFKGTWALDGKGNLCRTFDGAAPSGTPNPLCTPITEHKLGDTWTMDANGWTSIVTLKAGIQKCLPIPTARGLTSGNGVPILFHIFRARGNGFCAEEEVCRECAFERAGGGRVGGGVRQN